MSLEGAIRRTNDAVVVTVTGAHDALGLPGVVCLNPEDSLEKRRYQKRFFNKPIFLPDEYELAIKTHIRHPDNFILSMNGFSQISPEQARRYGIEIGAYEEACKAILRQVIGSIQQKFKGASLRLIHGASTDHGIDKAIQQVADEYNITPLGFSCPRYMLYAPDDRVPVYVAKDKKAYADRYIQTLDLLLATGGREQALQHDVLAGCLYGKRIHFIDVLNFLSSTGGVPATIIDENGRTRVDNAAAAMGRFISFYSYEAALLSKPPRGDIWESIFEHTIGIATKVCRDKMSPGRKFYAPDIGAS